MKKTTLVILLALILTAISVAQTQQTKFGSVTKTKESEQQAKVNQPTPTPTPLQKKAVKPPVKINVGGESNTRVVVNKNPAPTPTPTPTNTVVKVVPRTTPTPRSENATALPTPTPAIKSIPSPTPIPTPVDFTPLWQKFATEAEVRSHNVLTIGNNVSSSYAKKNEHVAENTLKSSGCPDTDLRCTYLASFLLRKSPNEVTRKFADKQVNKFWEKYSERPEPKVMELHCTNCEKDFRDLQVAASVSYELDPNGKRTKKLLNQIAYLLTMKFVDTEGKTTREANLPLAGKALLAADNQKYYKVVMVEIGLASSREK